MKKSLALMLALIMVLCMIPTTAFAKSNSTVVLHPSVNHTVTGVKVKVGDKIDGHPITKISGYDITVDLGKYNVNNDTFRLPYAKDIWEGVDNNKVDYISWAGSGSNKRSEGASALLANGKNTAYYYFKGAPTYKTFTLKYDANGGTGAPATQTYTATSQYENSHTFTISNDKPTRQDYEFKGWAETPNATTATRQPGGSIVVTGTTTLYAVWEENNTPTPTPGTDPTPTPGTDPTPTPGTDPTPTPGTDPTPTPGTDPTPTPGTDPTPTPGTDPTPTPGTDPTPTPPPSDTPSKPDANTLKYLLDKIKVTCVTNNTAHGTKEFDLIDGSYTVGDVEGDANSGYTCDIIVHPALYVAEYVKDFGKPHTLSPAGQTGTITLIYDAEEQAWKPMPTDPIVFNVTCSDEDETFTVTYLDGFSGTYATYPNLKYGDATPVPANPYRYGYIFLGWEPSVAPTVTGDARYVAQWGYIGPQYPNPTPVQPVQPGIRPPQTGDMPLWYAIARFLGLVK